MSNAIIYLRSSPDASLGQLVKIYVIQNNITLIVSNYISFAITYSNECKTHID